jgi:membrane dipeptidase
MRRIPILLVLALCAAVPAFAQDAARLPLVGVLRINSPDNIEPFPTIFRAALAALGQVDGRNIRIELHQGLSEFGAEVIRACHRLGFVCDVAHATEDVAMQAVKVTTKPLLLSHTAVQGSRAMGPTPLRGRQISPDHARAIAETGGSVGVWHFFPSLDRYVDGFKEMAEIVGVDHVSIGTDQFDARGCLEDYTRWVHLVAAMLRGGFTAEEPGKIAGGNYIRIFRAAAG